MADINFPAWVTNDTEIPPGFLVRAKKLIYTFVAVEKLRVLHNAGWKWHRGEALTADEEMLLQDAFPGLWPNPPTEAQVRNWLAIYWEPRHNAAQATRCTYRHTVTPAEFSYMNLDNLI